MSLFWIIITDQATPSYITQLVTTSIHCDKETADFTCACLCSEIVQGCANIGQQLQNIDLTLPELCDGHQGLQVNGKSVAGNAKTNKCMCVL